MLSYNISLWFHLKNGIVLHDNIVGEGLILRKHRGSSIFAWIHTSFCALALVQSHLDFCLHFGGMFIMSQLKFSSCFCLVLFIICNLHATRSLLWCLIWSPHSLIFIVFPGHPPSKIIEQKIHSAMVYKLGKAHNLKLYPSLICCCHQEKLCSICTRKAPCQAPCLPTHVRIRVCFPDTWRYT